MSIIQFGGSPRTASCSFLICLAAAGTAGASSRHIPDDPGLLLNMAVEAEPGSATTSSQSSSSASAWSESSGDHGITMTTTTSGNQTACMIVEWKREKTGIKKWQYRCDAVQP